MCGTEVNNKNKNVIPGSGYSKNIPHPTREEAILGTIHLTFVPKGSYTRVFCKNCFIQQIQEKLQELIK
jgi:hypothetical protein